MGTDALQAVSDELEIRNQLAKLAHLADERAQLRLAGVAEFVPTPRMVAPTTFNE